MKRTVLLCCIALAVIWGESNLGAQSDIQALSERMFPTKILSKPRTKGSAFTIFCSNIIRETKMSVVTSAAVADG